MAVAFSGEVDTVLHRGFARARDANHLSMTVEHLALEMLKEAPMVKYLRECGTDVDTVKALLDAKVASFRAAQIETVGTQPNGEFSRAIRRSTDAASRAGRHSILLADLFLAILEEREGFTASLILQQTPDPGAFDELRRRRSKEARPHP